MKVYNALLLYFLCLLMLGSCEDGPDISEEQAKSIVVDAHSKHIGHVEVIEITHSRNKWIVEWKNEKNCEKGKDYVDDGSGNIKVVEFSIC